jgi:hypothetical protein
MNVWCYTASNGCTYYGIFKSFYDRGGTDVSYHFHRLGDDGLPIVFDNGGIRLDIVSGSSLKNAKRVGTVKQGEAFKR